MTARNYSASLLSNIPITNCFDLNRDAQVNSTDVLFARNNPTSIGNVTRFLSIANPPAAPEVSPALNEGEVASALSAQRTAGLSLVHMYRDGWSIDCRVWISTPARSRDFFEHWADQNTRGTRRFPGVADEVADELSLDTNF